MYLLVGCSNNQILKGFLHFYLTPVSQFFPLNITNLVSKKSYLDLIKNRVLINAGLLLSPSALRLLSLWLRAKISSVVSAPGIHFLLPLLVLEDNLMLKHGLHFFALLIKLEFSHVRLPQLRIDNLLLLLMSALEELLMALE